MGRGLWFSIWTSPRITIREIVKKDARQGLWPLATIYGFASLCSVLQSLSVGSFYGPLPIFLFSLIFAPFWGYLVFGIWSYVVLWTGKLFKGSGDFQEVRAAYAWSCVPVLVSDAVWILLLIAFGSSLFLSPPVEQTLLGGQALILLCLLFLKVVCAVWSLVIYINALAEVQGFSILRAIGNMIVAMILLGIIFGIILMGLGMAFNMSAPETSVSMLIFPIFQEGISLQIL